MFGIKSSPLTCTRKQANDNLPHITYQYAHTITPEQLGWNQICKMETKDIVGGGEPNKIMRIKV